MAIFLLAIGVKRFVDRQMTKKHRSPLEYVALTSLALLVAAIAKYPNRAIFTRARPDLKEITADGHPLFGNMLQALTSKENPLIVLHKAFQKRGDIYVITVPYRGRFFMVNHPMYIEYILKSKSLILFFSFRLLSLVDCGGCFPPCAIVFFRHSFLTDPSVLPYFPYFGGPKFVRAMSIHLFQLRIALTFVFFYS